MRYTAILVDGGFFMKRGLQIFGKIPPEELAEKLFRCCIRHLKIHNHSSKNEEPERDELYRIFYYDCPPLAKKVLHPVTKKPIDFSKSERTIWRNAFYAELKKKRKIAIRMGRVDDSNTNWVISPRLTKKVINGTVKIEDLTEDDVTLTVKQKGVDMRIGVDIASLAFKKQVQRIILIAGDSDFVPAAKLARREGIDFILDPMHAPVTPDLFEHIDGLKSAFPTPNKSESEETEQ